MRSHRGWLALHSLALVLFASSTVARANLILSAEPLVLTSSGPGSTARLMVTIASDNGTDVLDSFGVEFRLTTSNGRYISFVNPPTDSQIGDATYIFHDDSAAEIDGPPSGTVLSNTNPDDTYVGGDGTLSGLGVAVPLADPLAPKLLVALDITAVTALAPQDGDVFFLTLERGSFTFFDGTIPPTGGLPPTLSVNFDQVPITISISSIPEPSSILGAGLGLMIFLTGAAIRRRASATLRPGPAS